MFINTFNFNSPTKIVFGEGTASSTADMLAELNCSKPLVVTDKILMQKGILEPVLQSLADQGINDAPVFDDVPSDSDIECVRKGVSVGRANGVDSIIAVGG